MKVCLIADNGDGMRRRTHEPSCRWVAGVTVRYRTVPVSGVDPKQPKCSRCGGGR